MVLTLGARQLILMLLELRLCAAVIVGLPLGTSLQLDVGLMCAGGIVQIPQSHHVVGGLALGGGPDFVHCCYFE